MTVKELREILDCCNDDANLFIEGSRNIVNGLCIMDYMVYADPDGRAVRVKIDAPVPVKIKGVWTEANNAQAEGRFKR